MSKDTDALAEPRILGPALQSFKIGDVLTLTRRPVKIEATATYREIGLRSFGKGIFHKDPVLGAVLGRKRVFEIHPDELVFSNVFAWEGALAISTQAESGMIGSHRFMTYKVNSKIADIDYLRIYFLREQGLAAIRAASPGSAGRNKTLGIAAFAAQTITLPAIEAQRRIVDLIRSADKTIEAADDLSRAADSLLRLRRGELYREPYRSSQTVAMAGDIFHVLMGRQRSPEKATGSNMRPYLRSANVLDGVLDLSDIKTMDFSQAECEKLRLLPGDVLVTEGSASVDAVGAAAAWLGDVPGDVCFQNTLLRYRGVEGVTTSRWTYHWCRWAYESGAFRDVAGGSNIKHIGYQRAVKMPVPNVDIRTQEQQASELDALESVWRAAVAVGRTLRHARSDLTAVLLSGEHQVPESYDDLLGA